MNVIVCFKEYDGCWTPAHPGVMTDRETTDALIDMMIRDGYEVGIIFERDYMVEMVPYEEYEGGDIWK